MNNVMVDLETLGDTCLASVVTIGAVFFDEYNIGEKFYTQIDLEDAKKHGEISESTMNWWAEQSEEAKHDLLNGTTETKKAILQFVAFLQMNASTNSKDIKIWGNGSDFDNVILGNTFKSVGLEPTWKYWNNRCYRTMKNVFKDVQPDDFEGVKHNAVDDAVYQVKHLQKILQHKNIKLV